MSGDEHQEHTQAGKRSAVAVTLGAVAWIVYVIFIVARGWGA